MQDAKTEDASVAQASMIIPASMITPGRSLTSPRPPQTPGPVDRPLNHPSELAQATAMRCSTLGDGRFDPHPAEQCPQGFAVVASVGLGPVAKLLGPTRRPAHLGGSRGAPVETVWSLALAPAVWVTMGTLALLTITVCLVPGRLLSIGRGPVASPPPKVQTLDRDAGDDHGVEVELAGPLEQAKRVGPGAGPRSWPPPRPGAVERRCVWSSPTPRGRPPSRRRRSARIRLPGGRCRGRPRGRPPLGQTGRSGSR